MIIVAHNDNGGIIIACQELSGAYARYRVIQARKAYESLNWKHY